MNINVVQQQTGVSPDSVMPHLHFHIKVGSVRAAQDNFRKLSGTWLSYGSYGVYMAVAGSTCLLKGLCHTLILQKMALHGSYSLALREGVTAALYRKSTSIRHFEQCNQ